MQTNQPAKNLEQNQMLRMQKKKKKKNNPQENNELLFSIQNGNLFTI